LSSRVAGGIWEWNLSQRATRSSSCGGEGDCGNDVTVTIIEGKYKWMYSVWDFSHRLRDVAELGTCTWKKWPFGEVDPSDGPYSTPLEGTTWSSCETGRPYPAWARVNIYKYICP